MRTTLNVAEPTINLNTCALDDLQRIPKLTTESQKELIRLRHARTRNPELGRYPKTQRNRTGEHDATLRVL